MRTKSDKIITTEKWVDDYIFTNGFPPTYEILAIGLNISKTSAFSRCTRFKNKMKQNKISNEIKFGDVVEFTDEAKKEIPLCCDSQYHVVKSVEFGTLHIINFTDGNSAHSSWLRIALKAKEAEAGKLLKNESNERR